MGVMVDGRYVAEQDNFATDASGRFRRAPASIPASSCCARW
jgi:hypothetical protein